MSNMTFEEPPCESVCTICRSLELWDNMTEQVLVFSDLTLKMFLCDACNKKGPSCWAEFAGRIVNE